MDKLVSQLQDILQLRHEEAALYVLLLRTGQASVRKLAEELSMARSSVHRMLQNLAEHGVVQRGQKKGLATYVACNPRTLVMQLEEQQRRTTQLMEQMERLVPALEQEAVQDKPYVVYYQGVQGVRDVLLEILAEASPEELLRVYSTEELRGLLYEALPDFTARRIARGLKARVIKMGGTGVLRGLDEARVLPPDERLWTYTHIYGDKVVTITAKPEGYVLAVVTQDARIAATQAFLFDALWERLPESPIPKVEKDF